ncbi:MAG TPA: lytic transglycosylase F [Thermoanaerobaculia bacterium]|nr:lytic transglycosylase F [Thermoanaerobaculia bacterium]
MRARRDIPRLARIPFAVALLLAVVHAPRLLAQSSRASTSELQPGAPLPTHRTLKAWTGDLDGMIERRQIRVLVTYSKTHYFIDRFTQRGAAYDAFRLFEDDLNKTLKSGSVRVHVIFLPVSRDEIIPALLAGKGDIAAASLTITPDRLEKVDFTDPTFKNVSEIVVTGAGSPPIATIEDLSGKEVYVRKSSSFYEGLETLNATLAKAGKPPVKLRLAPETLETEDLLDMVNAGLVQATIADDFIAGFWKQVLPHLTLNRNATLRTGADIAWMIRKGSPKLKAALNRFLARYPPGSSTRNQLLQKYFKSSKFAREATSPEEAAKFRQVVELFRKYCGQYDLDYLLVAAQGYQESRLDQNAKSHVGAIGVMQVMPPTGKEMGVGDITLLEPNIHAGVKYVRFMMTKYYGGEPMDALNKELFTFASYNAGPARIAQMRRLAAERGLDKNVWFNNVELVVAERMGRETVTYVSNIYKYYLAYQMVVEQLAEREKSLKAIEGQTPKP